MEYFEAPHIVINFITFLQINITSSKIEELMADAGVTNIFPEITAENDPWGSSVGATEGGGGGGWDNTLENKYTVQL